MLTFLNINLNQLVKTKTISIIKKFFFLKSLKIAIIILKKFKYTLTLFPKILNRLLNTVIIQTF